LSSRIRSFLAELKRRKVVRVAVVYVVVGLVVVEAANNFFPNLNLAPWTVTLVVALTILGFPIALVLAWALELTPQGIRVTPPAEPTGAPATEPDAPVTVRGPTDDRPCVVVLPFANLSGDPENEFFSDGVTEDIMARLAGIRGLRIISRTTAMRYKGSGLSVPQIGAELGAQAVVEGTVRRSADRVRVTAQLIAAERDEHLWADTYDRVLEDVFAVQRDVAENIARALRAELTPGERERLHRKPTENLEAYDLCLRGMRVGEPMYPEAVRKAERYFREAIALDPGYARAYAGLAWTLGLSGFAAMFASSEVFPQAQAAARQALRLDPSLAEAHTALAMVAFFHEWDWAEGLRELGKALELNPDDSLALGYRGWLLVMLERFAEAEAPLNEAVRLDPLSPLRRIWLAQLLAYTGRAEEGVALLDGLLRRDPQAYIALHFRGLCHMYSGNLAAAARDFDEGIARFDRFILPVAMRGIVYALAGETERARQFLEELRSRATHEYADPYYFFAISVLLDGFDAAFPYLEQMLEARSCMVGYLRVAPRYKELRSDPRFMNALRTIWPDDF
jgi:adenylate cyclase